MFDDLATVNIHNKGMIPWLNVMGPRYNISISWPLYNKLKEDPNIIMHFTNNDPVMNKILAERAQAKAEAAKPIVVEKVEVPETKEEVIKLGEQVPLEGGMPEPYKEIPALEEQKVLFEAMTKNIDAEIEAKLAEVVEVEDDVVVQPTEADLIEIEEHKNFKRYTREELATKTKAQIKQILNVERGHTPGHKFYGGYHDNLPELIDYVLRSQ